jgi:quercetin dioxygenase-like cupin family protein
MPTGRLLGRTVFLVALLALSASIGVAQDPVKVAPESYQVSSENNYVRVLAVHLKASAKGPMHAHPGYVAVALTPCKVRFTSPDGKSQDVDLKEGEATWRDAESHSVENLGASECRALNIEVKAAKAKKGASGKAK